MQSSNALSTAGLLGKSGLFKVMVTAPGIDQVSEPQFFRIPVEESVQPRQQEYAYEQKTEQFDEDESIALDGSKPQSVVFSSLNIDAQSSGDDMQFLTLTQSEMSQQPSPSPMRSSLFKVLKKSDLSSQSPSQALSKSQTAIQKLSRRSRSSSVTSTEPQDSEPY